MNPITLLTFMLNFIFWFIVWVIYFSIQLIEASLAWIFKWVKKPLEYLLDRTMPEAIKKNNKFIK